MRRLFLQDCLKLLVTCRMWSHILPARSSSKFPIFALAIFLYPLPFVHEWHSRQWELYMCKTGQKWTSCSSTTTWKDFDILLYYQREIWVSQKPWIFFVIFCSPKLKISWQSCMVTNYIIHFLLICIAVCSIEICCGNVIIRKRDFCWTLHCFLCSLARCVWLRVHKKRTLLVRLAACTVRK